MRTLSQLLLLSAFVVLSGTAQAGLIISEIMYKPSAQNNTTPTSDEWFEVFNSGPSTVDLSTIKFAHSTNASTGVLLNNGSRVTSQTPSTATTASTGLAAGAYAVIGSKTLSAWQSVFGNLSVGATYVQLGTWVNFADGGEDLTLYSTSTASNFFTVNYSHPQRNGVSVEYVGTNAALAQPFSFTAGKWQDATTVGGGTSTDKHTAGTGSLAFTSPPASPSSAPEPASLALMGIAGAGLSFATRRKKSPAARAGY
jgi:hypothetical protein